MNKVLIVKNYLKTNTDYDDTTYHNFHTLEEVKELTNDQLNTLRRAVDHFNRQPKERDYTINIMSIVDDSELDTLLLDFNTYEETARLKYEAEQKAIQQQQEEKKAKAKAKALNTKVKSLAKTLNMSEDEVREMLAKNG